MRPDLGGDRKREIQWMGHGRSARPGSLGPGRIWKQRADLTQKKSQQANTLLTLLTPSLLRSPGAGGGGRSAPSLVSCSALCWLAFAGLAHGWLSGPGRSWSALAGLARAGQSSGVREPKIGSVRTLPALHVQKGTKQKITGAGLGREGFPREREIQCRKVLDWSKKFR